MTDGDTPPTTATTPDGSSAAPVDVPDSKPITIKIDDSLSKEDFIKLTQSNVELQTQLDAANKEKEDVQKQVIIDKLTAVNPKLAEINKDADLNTLNIILSTVDNINSDFKKHKSAEVSEDKPLKKGVAGYSLLGSDKYLGIE